MRVTINGKEENIEPCKLGALIQAKGLKPQGLVVEYNKQIVKQARWDEIQLKEDDSLELLSFVGGG